MEYRNWRQWWCKKEGNKEKGNETKILYLVLLLVLLHLHVLNIGFLSHYPFLKTLFPSFLHHLCLQFLYPTNFLVRECFSLLVSSIFFIYWQVPPPPPPPPPPPASITVPTRADARFCLIWDHCTEHGRILTRRLDFGGIPLVV